MHEGIRNICLQVLRRGTDEKTVTASLDNVARGQSLLTSLSADDMQ